jgi:lysylphosphatidylglycerol synthase-like protein
MTGRMRALAAAFTAVILILIARRVAIGPLLAAFREADYVTFLALMVPNTIFYFCWDTLVLTTVVRWFHADVSYREILPIRAASYVVGFFNTNAGRGAVAAYLWRRLDAPLLELGSTVIFLVLTEYTQLVLWAMLGLFAFRGDLTPRLLAIAASVAAFWIVLFAYTRLHVTPARMVRWIVAPREWALLRSFRLATVARYATVVLLRAPMFAVSLCAHFYAAHAFGIFIPFGKMLTFLPVIFMAAALPVTVGHLGTTQAAWLFFFGQYAPAPRLLAFSLAAHLTFTVTRALLGVAWLPVAYRDLTGGPERGHERVMIGSPAVVDSRN